MQNLRIAFFYPGQQKACEVQGEFDAGVMLEHLQKRQVAAFAGVLYYIVEIAVRLVVVYSESEVDSLVSHCISAKLTEGAVAYIPAAVLAVELNPFCQLVSRYFGIKKII